MNYKDYVKEKLKHIQKENIIFSTHAFIRLVQRQMDKEEIIENIINPYRLTYALKEPAEGIDEEKFDCYFGYSKTLCHRYLLVIKKEIIIVSVIKINRRWQKSVEDKLKQ